MELSVPLFVLIAVSCATVGFVMGLLLSRWQRPTQAATVTDDTPQVATLKAKLDDAAKATRRDTQARNKLQAELEASERRGRELEDQLALVEDTLVSAEDRARVAERELEHHRLRFRDIVGLESENATLRAIAARVPELEARLDRIDADGTVIDLRERARSSNN